MRSIESLRPVIWRDRAGLWSSAICEVLLRIMLVVYLQFSRCCFSWIRTLLIFYLIVIVAYINGISIFKPDYRMFFFFDIFFYRMHLFIIYILHIFLSMFTDTFLDNRVYVSMYLFMLIIKTSFTEDSWWISITNFIFT